ncbi:MAG: ABC transporter permease [Acidobacteriia bacterium]|nr:ABC transporter permease [Terriglobia bacterium]
MRHRYWFGGRRQEADLDAELAAHRAMACQDRIDRGESPEDALRSVRREWGSDALIREVTRQMWGWQTLERLQQDLHHAARALRKSPGFTAVAVLTLALGIGATTALFSAIEAVLLRPLPYARPDRLVWVTRPSPKMPEGPVLTPEFAAWRTENHAFSGLAAWNDQQFNLTRAGEPELVVAATVNADFLRVLGVEPMVGRDFDESQDRPGNTRFVLLGYALWQRHFGGNPNCIGRTVALNDVPYTMVGILPRNFLFPGGLRPELLVTGGYSGAPEWNAQSMGLLHVIGRVREGLPPAQVKADVAAIERRHRPDMPTFFTPIVESSRIELTPLARQLSGPVRRPLLVLWGAVTLVLLLICANVVGLQLARASARTGELALRAALGAGRMRLARLLLGESLMVALAGGVLGVVGAFWLVREMRTTEALRLPAPDAVQVNPTVLLFAASVTLLSGLLAGLAPSLAASRLSLQQAMKGSSRGVARGWRGGLRSALVVGEVALALVLLLGAGLLLRSMQKLLAVPMGFDAGRVLTLRMRLENQRYQGDDQAAAFGRALLERARSLPGVDRAAIANSLPLTNYNLGSTLYFEASGTDHRFPWSVSSLPDRTPSNAQRPAAAILEVTPDYLSTLGIPLLAGRGVEDADAPGAPPVAMVNRAFARRFYGGQSPIGRHLQVGMSDSPRPWITVVGMVGDVRHMGPEREPEPELYLPFAQHPTRVIGLAIRSHVAPELLAAAVRQQIHAIDPDLPIFDVSTMDARLAKATGSQRLELALLGFFAALATLLAALGVYGVIAYAVSQSTHEIGVRLALGAAPGSVQRTVVGRGLRLGMVGVALGLAGGYGLTTYLATLLYETGAHDVGTFAGAGGVLLGMAAMASYFPARRAARVEPMAALRCE